MVSHTSSSKINMPTPKYIHIENLPLLLFFDSIILIILNQLKLL